MKDDSKPKEFVNVTFDGKTYAIDSLTPRITGIFKTLVKLQEDVDKHSYELVKATSAQKEISKQLKTFIEEDKIKELEPEKTQNSK